MGLPLPSNNQSGETELLKWGFWDECVPEFMSAKGFEDLLEPDRDENDDDDDDDDIFVVGEADGINTAALLRHSPGNGFR